MGDQELERKGEDGIRELLGLLTNGEFRNNYVRVQTAESRGRLEDARKEIGKKADQKASEVLMEEIAKSMGVSVDEARTKPDFGREMGKKNREMVEQTLPDGKRENVTRKSALSKRFFEVEMGDLENMARFDNLNNQLKREEKQRGEELTRVIEEVRQRFADEALVGALGLWGRSPNARGEKGDDGRGFNAGVIHYFEYRTDEDKNGRYKGVDQMSVQGFIDYSLELADLLKNPTSEKVVAARLLRDEEGQERVVLVNSKDELVIGFKREDESELKIVTVIPGQDQRSVDKAIEGELMPGNRKGRLNALGNNIVEVPLISVMA